MAFQKIPSYQIDFGRSSINIDDMRVTGNTIKDIYRLSVGDLVMCMVKDHKDFGKIGKINSVASAKAEFDIDVATRVVNRVILMPMYYIDFEEEPIQSTTSTGYNMNNLKGLSTSINTNAVHIGGSISSYGSVVTYKDAFREDDLELAFSK